jgi:hypothetical protein
VGLGGLELPTKRLSSGLIRAEPGNLRSIANARWGWEDSNFQPSGYCQVMGDAEPSRSASLNHHRWSAGYSEPWLS